MKERRWKIGLGLGLLTLSVVLFLVHYAVFRDAKHIWIYLLHDLAFIPVEVLLVTLILHELLDYHTKRDRLNKMNMAIGVFFSQAGTELLRRLARQDPQAAALAAELHISAQWTAQRFQEARRAIGAQAGKLACPPEILQEIRAFLHPQRDFLLSLLGNPNLLEHQAFTDLLWAVFHLADELAHRPDLAGTNPADLQHLTGDAQRVYEQLLGAWLAYMQHLQREYPYLFSLAVRTNPFAAQGSVCVQ